jgi:16S rRNA (cytidine1402-2'-O)-methyltransferase
MPKTIVYIVALPIGNDRDISIRAKEILSTADILVGEESKFLSSFLKRIGIPRKFVLYNEHSDQEDLSQLLGDLKNVPTVAIVSDAGLPNLEDPGRSLLPAILDSPEFQVQFVPGASSLDAGLALCGFSTRPFTFVGLLPRETLERKEALRKFLSLGHSLVILETPYRYKKLIADLAEVMGKKSKRRIFLGLNLTHPSEELQFRGHLSELLPILEKFPKAPPVIVIESD